jgi:hypothetical protein
MSALTLVGSTIWIEPVFSSGGGLIILSLVLDPEPETLVLLIRRGREHEVHMNQPGMGWFVDVTVVGGGRRDRCSRPRGLGD